MSGRRGGAAASPRMMKVVPTEKVVPMVDTAGAAAAALGQVEVLLSLFERFGSQRLLYWYYFTMYLY